MYPDQSPIQSPISVVNPVATAFGRMSLILFKPFDLGKWFVLGFCAFLAHLGEGGGGGSTWSGPPGGGGGGGGGGGVGLNQFLAWLRANMGTVIVVTGLIVLLLIGITALVLWLRSRGKFMFLDGVARNEAAVVRPWKQFRVLADSLFGFTLALALLSWLVFLMIIGSAVAIAWPDFQNGEFSQASITALVVLVGLIVPTTIALALINAILNDFVAPVMYLRREPVMEAWRTVRRELFAGRVGTFVLFYLMRILLGIAIGTAAFVATCATCCIAAIPYLGTVILLPLFVFSRCYPLCFLEQFGPDWRIFVEGTWTHCPRCGYDLHGAPTAGVCPECGTPYGTPVVPAAPPVEPPEPGRPI